LENNLIIKNMLPNWYNTYKEKIENSIDNYLIEYFKNENNDWLVTFKEATIYSLKWWKRIRAILALEFYLIFSWKNIDEIKDNDNIIKFCIALELLHAYSLIHDDLPCMDNDILRRWQPTVWKKYGEANAVLVWDLLNSLSFELISEIWNIALLKLFWKAVWIKWMAGWQILDLYYENNSEKLTLDDLIEIHNRKTWALIEISIIWWIIFWNLSLKRENKNKKSELIKYSDFWKKIGLAFQVKDDLLDIDWTFEETWKSVWWEDKGFVHFIWIKKSREYLNSLMKDCQNILLSLNSEKLNFLVSYIWNRKK